MKAKLSWLIIWLLILTMAVGCSEKPVTPTPTPTDDTQLLDEVIIGATYALTGPAAIYSKTIVNAINMALEEINDSDLYTAELDIILEDDRTDNNEAINLYQRYIDRDKVHVIIGPLLGRQVFSAAPIAQEKKTPVLLTSVATAGVTGIGDYIFRTSIESTKIIPYTVEAAVAKLGIKTVAIFYTQDDEFSVGEFNAFKSALDAKNVEILTIETHITGDMDFKAQLSSIKSANPDAIVLAAQGEEIVSITSQAKAMGIEQRFLGGNAFNSNQVLQEAGAAMYGALSATPWFIEMQHKENVEFVEKYKLKFDEDPDWLAAQTYDALYIIADAVERAQINKEDSLETARDKIRDAFAATSNFSGVLGVFGFDDIGDPTISGAVITNEGGKHVLFK